MRGPSGLVLQVQVSCIMDGDSCGHSFKSRQEWLQILALPLTSSVNWDMSLHLLSLSSPSVK